MPYYPQSIIQDFLQQYIAGDITPPTAHRFLYSIWDSNNEIQYGANYRMIYDDPEKLSMLDNLGLNTPIIRSSSILTSLSIYFKNP